MTAYNITCTFIMIAFVEWIGTVLGGITWKLHPVHGHMMMYPLSDFFKYLCVDMEDRHHYLETSMI